MKEEFEYGLVVDAGSSGSRIFLYKWPSGGGPTTEVFNEEITPGLSDQEHGLTALQTLVSSASRNLANHHHGVDAHNVPIYLGATAGLRRLESDEREATMSRIRSLLHKSDFLFEDNYARVISGEEEGVYDWLTINYMKNGGALPTLSTPTYGALDLGGASTQISFRSRGRRFLMSKDAFPLQIDNSKYLLYSQSFLHYGVDEARLTHARQTASLKDAVYNPCFPVGYKDEVTNLPGGSNWDECLESVAQMFEPTNRIEEGFHRATLAQYAAQEDRFVATSAFVFAWDFLGLQIGAATDDLATLNEKAKEICNMDFSQQMRQYKSRRRGSSVRATTKPYAQCFNAAWCYNLLSKGYSMPVSNTPIEIHDIKSWTLGMMLVEANKLLTKNISDDDNMIYIDLLQSYKCIIAGSTLVLLLLTSFIWRRRKQWEKSCLLPYEL
jgi:Golgi nucleoside diphosphatase